MGSTVFSATKMTSGPMDETNVCWLRRFRKRSILCTTFARHWERACSPSSTVSTKRPLNASEVQDRGGGKESDCVAAGTGCGAGAERNPQADCWAKQELNALKCAL